MTDNSPGLPYRRHFFLKTAVFALSFTTLLFIFSTVFWHLKSREYKEKYRNAKKMTIPPARENLSNLSGKVLASLINGDEKQETGKILKIMVFVNSNSEHLIDQEHAKYAFDPVEVLERMSDYSSGKSKQKPHLSCGPRADAMKSLLDAACIVSRRVHVYSNTEGGISSHTFLEVMNPDSNRWECWDPDFNVFFLDPEGAKVGIAELIQGDCEKITPCSPDGIQGWDPTKTARLKRDYFGAALLESSSFSAGMRDGIVITNGKKFDPDKRAGAMSFRKWANKNYGVMTFISCAE